MIAYRKIENKDNSEICRVIRETLKEYGGDRSGTAYYDYDTEHMYEAYQNKKEIYYVAEVEGKVVGGCGIKHLTNVSGNIAELQKLYLLSQYRGIGIGKNLVVMCINFAKKVGFDAIYLETFQNMKSAQKLYTKNGFEYIDKPLGGTGHTSCDVWMLKKMNI